MAVKGENVWFELLTTDVDGAKAFYTETIGWKTQVWGDGDPNMPPYTMWMVGETAIGGVMDMPEEPRKAGAPTHWLAYTNVDNADQSAKKAESLGGKIYKEPFDIPNVGRIAVLGDPQGAAFAIIQPQSEMQGPDRTKQQMFSWAELNTTDYEAAWKFYADLFDWKHRETMDMGPMGHYLMWQDSADHTKGGMSNAAKQMKLPPHWLHYVTVDDIEAAVQRIKDKGGKVLNGPMPIPGDDFIAQCQDPQGGFFAIYQEGKKK